MQTAQQMKNGYKTFLKAYPDAISYDVDSEGNYVTVCEYNSFGNLIALGSVTGIVLIHDLTLNSTVKKYSWHVKAIQAIAWSSCNNYVVTAGADSRVILLNVHKENCGVIGIWPRLPSPPTSVKFHPSNSGVFIVGMVDAPMQIVNAKTAVEEDKVALKYDSRNEMKLLEAVNPECVACPFAGKLQFATFSMDGKYILGGNDYGIVSLLEYPSLNLISWFKLYRDNTGIRSLVLSPGNFYFLANCDDKKIRVYDFSSLFPQTDSSEPSSSKTDIYRVYPKEKCEFAHPVNKVMWLNAIFSRGCEYVVASSSRGSVLYLWSIQKRSIVKEYQMPRPTDCITYVTWHPVLAEILLARAGTAVIFRDSHKTTYKSWVNSYYNLDGSVDFQESEDMFDLVDEDKPCKIQLWGKSDKLPKIVQLTGAPNGLEPLPRDKKLVDLDAHAPERMGKTAIIPSDNLGVEAPPANEPKEGKYEEMQDALPDLLEGCSLDFIVENLLCDGDSEHEQLGDEESSEEDNDYE